MGYMIFLIKGILIISNWYHSLINFFFFRFRTEFHIKFLWGSKGALAAAVDRHTKLEQVLSLMSDKFCNGDQISTTVTTPA